MAAGSTYTAIQTQTLSSNQTTVTLSSISQAYTDLILVVNATWNSGTGNCFVTFSGDTSSNYSFTRLSTNGTANASAAGNSQTSLVNLWDMENPTTSPGVFIFQIKDYSTTSHKPVFYSHNTTTDYLKRYLCEWHSTSTVTSITFTSSTILSGSMFTLYGIKAA